MSDIEDLTTQILKAADKQAGLIDSMAIDQIVLDLKLRDSIPSKAQVARSAYIQQRNEWMRKVKKEAQRTHHKALECTSNGGTTGVSLWQVQSLAEGVATHTSKRLRRAESAANRIAHYIKRSLVEEMRAEFPNTPVSRAHQISASINAFVMPWSDGLKAFIYGMLEKSPDVRPYLPPPAARALPKSKRGKITRRKK